MQATAMVDELVGVISVNESVIWGVLDGKTWVGVEGSGVMVGVEVGVVGPGVIVGQVAVVGVGTVVLIPACTAKVGTPLFGVGKKIA